MKFLLRALFYAIMLYGCYWLLNNLANKQGTLPTTLKHYAEAAMQQYLCQTPVLWKIGELDPAFDLSYADAEDAALRASAQWNEALGREVFRYDSIDGFAINFRYDERQQQMLQQALLQRNVDRYDHTINQRLAGLQQDNNRLQQRLQQFDADKQQLTADLQRFEQKVRQGNSDRHNLQQEQQQLTRRQQQLQQQADELNAQQQRLQRDQQYLNGTINDRNALIPDSTPDTLAAEVGLMEIQHKHRTMTIFAYKTQADLELTLTHEFGHALGVGHIPELASVMHFAINPEQKGLTAEDIAAVKTQCGF